MFYLLVLTVVTTKMQMLHKSVCVSESCIESELRQGQCEEQESVPVYSCGLSASHCSTSIELKYNHLRFV